MKIGVHLPQWGGSATRSGVIDVAQAAEAVGLDSVWVADHIVFPVESESRYPYRPDGVPFNIEEGFLEALTQLAVVSGATSRVGLGTSVLVIAMRDPLVTAKVATTVDVLSDGRLQLAVGAGWWREEFEILGQRFDKRGARMDEQMDILRAAWTKPRFSHEGQSYRFPEVSCTPLPVQPGGPPLLVGGMGTAALRRAAQRGDGWHAVGADVDTLREARTRLDEFAWAADRDPKEIIMSTSAGVSRDPDRAVARLQNLAHVGIEQVVLNFEGAAVDIIQRIDWLAAEVLPALDLSSQGTNNG